VESIRLGLVHQRYFAMSDDQLCPDCGRLPFEPHLHAEHPPALAPDIGRD